MERLVRGSCGLFILGAALMVAAVSGCGDSTSSTGASIPEGPMVTSEHHIKGGSVDGNSKAVVGLLIRRGGRGGICTGTLIARNLVLTARHCVAHLSTSRIRCGSTKFTGTVGANDVYATTDGTEIQNGPSDSYPVSKIRVPNPSLVCGNDIALLQLQNNIPSSKATPRPPRLSTGASAGESYTAIGYGQTGSGGGSGTRRRLENLRVQCVGGGCNAPGRVAKKEFAGSGGVCQGDSGGGAYVSNKKVIGIASRADRECRTSVYTRVYPWRSWIKKMAGKAASAGGYPIPSWTNVSDDDGDGVASSQDNCPNTANKDQKDTDGDGKGDVCDDDIDGDGVSNSNDNCPKSPNSNQGDLDGDGTGNVCDDDIDGDKVPNPSDLCPTLRNPEQKTSGSDDTCSDADGDRVADAADNCPNTRNPEQKDQDSDGTGDACDSDTSGNGSGTSGDTGTSTGGSPDAGVGGDDVAIIGIPEDDESSTRGTCSSSATDRPSRLFNFALLSLFLVGFTRLRRRD